MRADKEGGVHGFTLTRRKLIEGRDHANGVQIGIHFSGKVFTRSVFRQQPGRCKVVLHHGHIALLGCFLKIGFSFFDVRELNLLVFFRIGVNSGPREGHVKRRLTFRLVAIAHELNIQLWGRRGRACIDNFVRNLQSITAACQGVCFDQFQATRIGRLKCQDQFILTRFELTLASEFHGCFVRGKGAANQARLRQIDARLAIV